MKTHAASRWDVYAFAVAATALVVCVRLLWLDGILTTSAPFILFYLSITASAWHGGLRGGLFATALGFISASYFFYYPDHRSYLPQAQEDIARAIIFVVSGTLISLFCESLHVAKHRNEIKNDELAKEVEARQRSEAAMAESELRIRAILEAALDAIIVADADGIVRMWNGQAEAIFGWSAHEAIGRRMSEMIIPVPYRESHEIGMTRFLRTGEARILNKRIEITALNKKGEIFPVELTVTSQFHNGNHSFTAFVRDITEQRKIQESLQQAHGKLEQRVAERTAELAQSRSFLRTLIDNVADPIFVKDREHRWVEGNRAFWELIGPEAALKGKTDYDLFPKEQADKFWEGDERVFKGEKFDQEEHLRAADGKDRVIATKKVPFLLADGTQGLIGVIRDMTEHKKFEAELRQHRDHLQDMVKLQTRDLIEAKEKAESANIAKSEFLANMSHEIRTPMNAVIGLSNILSLSEPLTPRQRDFIKTLQMSADSLLALLNDLLDIAKIESRSVAFEQVPFSLSQLVQEVSSMMAVRVREKNLQFISRSECAQDRHFIGDPTRMRQIITNLCSNAIKFTEEGSVTVEIACQPAQTQGEEQITITVRDTGIGIPKDKMETIFHKFVQADTSISRRYGGTGLGLAITRTLVEIMGGRIEVDSEPGKGSVFTVHLALKVAQGAAMLTQDMHGPVKQRVENAALILLVEDYPPNVMVASAFLEEFGFPVEVARNGAEALECVRAKRYGLILMDVQMPGMNGFEATQLIREYERQEKLQRHPIIGMTAHALVGDRERCLSVGMDEYVSKPFNPEELERKIRAFLK